VSACFYVCFGSVRLCVCASVCLCVCVSVCVCVTYTKVATGGRKELLRFGVCGINVMLTNNIYVCGLHI